MVSFVFGTGLALFIVGGVFVGQTGLAVACAGVLIAAVTGIRSHGRGLGRGVLVGLAESALTIAVTAWWASGHHVDWGAITAAIAGLALLVLVYIAFKVRQMALRRSV